MSGTSDHHFAVYGSGVIMQGLSKPAISSQYPVKVISGKSPIKLEVTSRHDHSCSLGRKSSNKQTLHEACNVKALNKLNRLVIVSCCGLFCEGLI